MVKFLKYFIQNLLTNNEFKPPIIFNDSSKNKKYFKFLILENNSVMKFYAC